ncbi:hypothetical protein Cgig2_011773 [Carnegiea gigantea]|uniref:SGF29 C-terminal domain-containing protein n=1 Tax=Carnegiea gigantea TaxID=171969 RepID=A0A9Q1GP53_9CARY|nr:hypothetical protein Cgig2_011773 [Carnegiea gigantea]
MMSAPDISSILDNSKELDRLRKEQEDVLTEINKMHKKLQTSAFFTLPESILLKLWSDGTSLLLRLRQCFMDLASASLLHGLDETLNTGSSYRIWKYLVESDLAFPTINCRLFLSMQPPEVVDKHGDSSLTKLKNLYARAKELSEIEVRVSNALLGQLDALLPPAPPGPRRRIEGNEQKKKHKKNDSDISRVSSYLRNQLDSCASLKGEQVAARVKSEDPEKDEYIVVKVINFDKETREFEVLDEEPGDDEEGSGQRKFKLPMSHIIPFPKRNDPSAAPDFPTGRAVLAVYPGTTTLYKATVVNPSRKLVNVMCSYLLEFDDDESEDGSMPQRTVPFYNVVPLPEGHRQ